MTAAPITWRPAPLRARLTVIAVATWTRARAAARARARRAIRPAQRIGSTVLELAGAAVFCAGLWTLAPWLGLVAGGILLAFAGWLLEPRPARRASLDELA